MHPLLKSYYTLRHLGPRFVWTRLALKFAQRSGTCASRYASRPWSSILLEDCVSSGTPTAKNHYAAFKRAQPVRFLFPMGQPPTLPSAEWLSSRERHPTLAERVDLLRQDRCVYFLHTPSPRPLDWYENPFTGTRAPHRAGWWEIPTFTPDQGDMRTMWEPARAAWAMDLARASAYGLADDAADIFWRWFDSWMDACPPFNGVHWICGQECAVRLIALATAFWAMIDEQESDQPRWTQFARLAWATGYRIENNISYAVSQKNNHVLSEACGLILVAHLFPEFKDAERWRNLGRHTLLRELKRQVYADGSYVQHSMNYHRVMLHVTLLAMRLGELEGQPFERPLYDLVAKSTDFLYQMSDPATGCVPQYGNDDGAYVLPLNGCDYSDFRPAIQASRYMTHRERRFEPGHWDEDMLWLYGAEALATKPTPPDRPQSTAFRVGGYFTLHQKDTWTVARCHTYVDRPGHCDPLHLDLWWRGLNVVRDCGTYQYYCPNDPHLEHYFKSIAAHNTIEIDGKDPLTPVSRFLWFPWPRGQVRHFEHPHDGAAYLEIQHDNYRLSASGRAIHRRAVLDLGDSFWLVVDDILGTGSHESVLRWHLLDAPFAFNHQTSALQLDTPEGLWGIAPAGTPADPRIEILQGTKESNRVQGFSANFYSQLIAIPTMEVSMHTKLPHRFVTFMGPNVSTKPNLVQKSDAVEHWTVTAGNTKWCIALNPPTKQMVKTLIGIQPAPVATTRNPPPTTHQR